jgi:ATP-dependent Clp protease, protease subunit
MLPRVSRPFDEWTQKAPGDEPPRGRLSAWLREKLFDRRIVLLTGELDDSLANEIVAALLSLDAISDEPIDLYVDSPDGTLGAAFALIDILENVRASIRIHCRGQIGGPVLGILAAGARRFAAAHARFRLGQPRAQFAGTPEQIDAQNRHEHDRLWRLCARLARATGRPAEEIAEDMRRGRWLNADEALQYGLVDEVVGR